MRKNAIPYELWLITCLKQQKVEYTQLKLSVPVHFLNIIISILINKVVLPAADNSPQADS